MAACALAPGAERMLVELLLGEAADDGHRRRNGLAFLAEQPGLLVEPVQSPGMH